MVNKIMSIFWLVILNFVTIVLTGLVGLCFVQMYYNFFFMNLIIGIPLTIVLILLTLLTGKFSIELGIDLVREKPFKVKCRKEILNIYKN